MVLAAAKYAYDNLAFFLDSINPTQKNDEKSSNTSNIEVNNEIGQAIENKNELSNVFSGSALLDPKKYTQQDVHINDISTSNVNIDSSKDRLVIQDAITKHEKFYDACSNSALEKSIDNRIKGILVDNPNNFEFTDENIKIATKIVAAAKEKFDLHKINIIWLTNLVNHLYEQSFNKENNLHSQDVSGYNQKEYNLGKANKKLYHEFEDIKMKLDEINNKNQKIMDRGGKTKLVDPTLERRFNELKKQIKDLENAVLLKSFDPLCKKRGQVMFLCSALATINKTINKSRKNCDLTKNEKQAFSYAFSKIANLYDIYYDLPKMPNWRLHDPKNYDSWRMAVIDKHSGGGF